MTETPVRHGDLRRVTTRSFHLQALLTPERMQGLAFGFALLPVLRRLYPATEECGRALKRHLAYFATHPVLGSYVLGAAARLEERRAAGEPIDDAAIDRVKRSMASPLAAMGDPLFWVTLRPLAGLAGVLALALLPPPATGDPDVRVLLCPLALLLTYNAVALPFRLRGVARGYAAADRPGALLRSLPLLAWNAFLERAGAFAFGALVAIGALGATGLAAGAAAGEALRTAQTAAPPLLLGGAIAAIGCSRRAGRTVETGLVALTAAVLLALVL
ncbi:MAG: PTS system mannose/fructose/sorbose family transporter subunit IID [Hyphomicrobiales bacterium]